MTRGKRRTYRGIFVTPTGEHFGLDFSAENLSLARAHAEHLRAHTAIHAEQGIFVRVLRVTPIGKDEMYGWGLWFRLTESLNS